jgi:diketogulonate reductase-like aldo/keto reductase
MENLQDYYILNNGVKIPCIGFGTWQTPNGEVAVSSIKEAISCGYRHIDTAAIYGNEESVGKAIRESKIKREELFVTSKLWNTDHGYDKTLKAFEATLNRLKLDYLDLYLIHWPVPIAHKNDYEKLNLETWRAFEKLYKEGKIKAIGVSNFLEHHLRPIIEEAEIKPMVNQIELHPKYPQEDIVSFCKQNNIIVEAWSPLGQGELFKLPLLSEVAKKYNKSVAQICIRWAVQRGTLPLPKSVHKNRIIENANVFDFEISEEDMDTIYNLGTDGRIGSHPDHASF